VSAATVAGRVRPLPEIRRDPVTGRWVIISSDRARQPQDFIREPVRARGMTVCPFCAGNEDRTPPELLSYRPNGGPEWRVRVISNKFPALRVEGDLGRSGDGLYDRMNGIGAHELIVETPQHCISLGELSEKQIEDIFWAFRDRVLDLRRDGRLRYILLFKNHGEAAGGTLEHTHSQLMGLPVVPISVQEELDGARRHFEYKERCIYCDVVRQEMQDGSRVVLESDYMLAVQPYAPRFPFETWIMPRTHISHFENSDAASIANLAWALRTLVRKLERVLEFPAYNMVLHSSPVQEPALPWFHWHLEIIPRLTRIAGFEWGTGFHINPTPPEEAAQFLREAAV
jgi:UDPglucose--hexose-1-phosphate uridylyltransferase